MGQVTNVGRCFYPRHPRGWRRFFSIATASCSAFLSTPPSRVATRYIGGKCETVPCFYPRHPRGWRHEDNADLAEKIEFLSTPPSRVATVPPSKTCRINTVSIHATLAGGDRLISPIQSSLKLFLSTPPSRVATPSAPCCISHRRAVSIHATLAGGDLGPERSQRKL